MKKDINNNREKILQEKESEEDVILNMSLRPQKMKDFIGQKGTLENLKISLEAAKKRKARRRPKKKAAKKRKARRKPKKKKAKRRRRGRR